MATWEEIRQLVSEKDSELESKTWTSEKLGVLQIIKMAEEIKIEPPTLEEFSLSKFRIIVKETKEAIRREDYERLEELINLTRTNSAKQLRIELEKKWRPTIKVNKEGDDYVLRLTGEQFDRIIKSTDQFFSYQIQKG